MKKKDFFLAILALECCGSFAQAPDWLWAKSGAGAGQDAGYSIAADDHGNSYVAGYFSGTSITFGNITLQGAGGGDLFIVKYDSAGNVVWAKSAGGAGDDRATGIALDAAGNIYTTGYFGPSIVFGSTTLINTGFGGDIFIAKYDTTGNVAWAKSAAGNQNDAGNGIATDKNGNTFITGYFRSLLIVFDTFTLFNLSNIVSGDIFIAKYDSSGNVVWARNGGGTYEDFGLSIAADPSGNCIATGYFRSDSATFAGNSLINCHPNIAEIYIVKYDPAGNVVWARSAIGYGLDEAYGIAADTNGNSYVVGEMGQDTTLTFGGITLTSIGGHDLFIAKYDASGNVVWANSAGSHYDDVGFSIAVDRGGNSYVTGIYTLDPITFGNTTLANSGSLDIFVVKCDAAGNPVWAKGVGNTDTDVGDGIAVARDGYIYVTGYFQSNILSFGNTTLVNSAFGLDENFTAKLLPAATDVGVLHLNKNTISIYPNPGNREISITSDKNIEAIKISNLLGEEVYKSYTQGQLLKIDVAEFNAGIYFIQLIAGLETFSRKLIIEK